MRVIGTIILLAVLSSLSIANNVKISNVRLVDQDVAANTTKLMFDLYWENSWKISVTPNNWDAVWVFAKYSKDNGVTWLHCTIENTGSEGPLGSIVDVSADGKGAFVYRASDGQGTIDWKSVKLRWNYGDDGLEDNEAVKLAVIGIEMVYMPEGVFAVGSGGNGLNEFTLTTINTPNSTQIPSGSGSLGGQAGGIPSNEVAPTSSKWPNGYKAIYCMKYEISQEQYCDFLNMLTAAQAFNRYPGSAAQPHRYAITGKHPNYSTASPYVACGFMNWSDCASYADWAGLRPMTEMEFEKACRGSLAPVRNEYAWGSDYYINAIGIINERMTDELPIPSNANCNMNNGGIGGPVRVGSFAIMNSDRIKSGGSYYGIMELSGNLWEQAVAVGLGRGREFIGSHGDGILSVDGYGTNVDWPGFEAGDVRGADGSCYRGGGWWDADYKSRVSDRSSALDEDNIRHDGAGFRAVRNAN